MKIQEIYLEVVSVITPVIISVRTTNQSSIENLKNNNEIHIIKFKFSFQYRMMHEMIPVH